MAGGDQVVIHVAHGLADRRSALRRGSPTQIAARLVRFLVSRNPELLLLGGACRLTTHSLVCGPNQFSEAPWHDSQPTPSAFSQRVAASPEAGRGVV